MTKCQICDKHIDEDFHTHMQEHIKNNEAVECRDDDTKEISYIKALGIPYYPKIECAICGKQISKGGAAFTAHMRAHVKRREAVEYKRGGKLFFTKPDISLLDDEPYARFGSNLMPNEPLPGQPKDVWELPDLKTILPAIDPASYFITSGEAVKKAEKLVKDIYALCNRCRQLRDGLRKARGSKQYLEVSFDQCGRHTTRGKDSRSRQDKINEKTDP